MLATHYPIAFPRMPRRLRINQMLTRALNFVEMGRFAFEEFFSEPYTPIGKIDSN